MKKSINISCLTFFCIICVNVNAQFDIIGTYNKQVLQNWSGTYSRIGPFKVKGSGYFLGEALSGIVKFKDHDLMQSKKLFYDLYNQEIVFQQGEDLLKVDEVLEELTITLPEKYGSKSMIFKNAVLYEATNIKGFFEVLEEGPNVSFLKMYKINIAPDPGNMRDRDAKLFEQYSEYYIFNTVSKNLIHVKLKSKEIKKALISSGLSSTNSINPDNYDLSKEQEVINFFKQINSTN